jgi:hypothetical protein
MTPASDVQGYYLVTDTGKLYAFGYGDRSSDSQTDIIRVAGVPVREGLPRQTGLRERERALA